MALALVAGAAEAEAATSAGAQPSPETILAHPSAFDPFTYALLVRSLWTSGHREQATFWFYVFQARTRPWADADTRGDNAAALRSALNEELGTVVNRWVGSDLGAWQRIVARALSYEAKLPLASARPAGLSKSDWEARVAKARVAYEAASRQTLFVANADQVARQRRAAGLYVGPLQNPGPPLPAGWQ